MSSENTVARSSGPANPAFDVIALVTSADERETLHRILGALPFGFPAAVISAQHESESDDLLSYQTALPLQRAAQDMPLKHGHIIVCSLRDVPTVKAEGVLTIEPDAVDKFSHPIDHLLESLARSYGERALAVVLGATQADGEKGIEALKAAGGTVIAESADPQTAAVTGAVDLQFPVGEIVAVLTDIITQRLIPPTFAPKAVVPGSHYAEQILENIDMFYVLDKNFCFTYLNRKAEESWGRSRADLLGKHYWTEFPKAIGSASYQMHLKVMADRQPVEYETISPILHRWVDVKIFPTTEGGLAVYFYDIDERKRRELNAAFLIEIDNDLAYLSDPEEILDAISEKIVRHFGLARLIYSRVDLAADHVDSFYEKRDPDVASGLRTFRLSDILSKEAAQELAAGQVIAIDDTQIDPRTAEFAHLYRSYDAQSQIRVPQLVKGELRFLVSAHHRDPHHWRADELEVMREVTARIYLWLERTNAEKALRESEAWLQIALNSARLGAWEWDAIRDMTRADKRTREILAVTADAPLSMASLLANRILPEDRTSVETALAAALDPQGAGWYDVAYRISVSGSDERWVHFTGQAVFEGEGANRRAVRMFGTVRDVTETKRAETAQQQLTAELAWQGRRFDAIASTAEDAIYTFDLSGRIAYANRRLLEIWQKTADETLGKTLWELDYPAEEAARITRQIEHVVATRQPLRDESIQLDFAGATAAYEYIFTPIINADGTVEGVAGISRDTTGRKQAENALHMSEERYRTLFESIDEGFCIIEVIFDADDKPVDYVFVETNPAFVGQTGLVSAEGKRARELVPLLEPHWFETYGRVARTGKPERFVDGSEAMGRWFDTYAFPYGDGQVGILFNDITQRRQASEALRASEQRFRRALEIETVGIIFFTPDGAITSANDAFLRMSGYTHEDIELGRLRWDELTPAEWMPASLDAIKEFMASGQIRPYEKQYYRKDGSRWWALFAAQRLSENEGIEFVVDITRQKEAELTLRETEERMRLILDSARDYSIYALDIDGNFISWNTGAERIFGYTEAQVLGQHQRLIYTPEDRAAGIPEREMQKALTQGYSDNERWHVRNDGRLIYGSGMVRPLRDADGPLRGFTKVMRDETDRKLAEARMQMLQQLAADLSGRLTVQDMGKGILETCRKSVAATKASLFLMTADGQSLEHFSDYTSDPVQEQYMHIPLDLSMPLTDAVRANQLVWGSTQDDYIQQYPHLRDDILLNNVHAFIALPLVFEQNILGSIAIVFSQPKALSREEHEFLVAVAHLCAQALERARLYEIEKEAREAAEKADQLKMQFLGMISHELRTPLASIKGYTSTLLATDVTFTAEEQREFLGVVDEETDKLTDLIAQLLDLTRLQAGSLRIALSAEWLNNIIEIARTQLWTLTLQHQFVMSLPNDLPPVLADRQRIAQVLVNLVGNATKFSPQRSPITISAVHESDFIRIDVSDEGPGIPLGQRTEVFEAFRQFERLTTSHDPGAGLGLAICKGIVEAHGGQIWVQDRETGTTISFTLQVAKEDV